MPGIRRVRHRRGFRYIDDKGHAIRRRADLDRIARPAIPPAWKDVWICPNPRGHLQAWYARDNRSFGLTTIRNKHVGVSKSTLRFRFKGKGGKSHDFAFNDVRLARIVRKSQDLPGHELFAYADDKGNVQDSGSTDVHNYLREVTGHDFTAKTFRSGS
jgi:DNA topoisomerase IB